MGRAQIRREGFELIEVRTSVTPDEFAEKFGISLDTARHWLSRWTSKGYLKYVKPEKGVILAVRGRPSGGKYEIGPRQWIDLYTSNNDLGE
jgi:hypothetical protein